MNKPFVTRDGNCRVITSVFAGTPDDLFLKISPLRDIRERIFEIRFDLFSYHEIRTLNEILGYMKIREAPFIFTYRTEDIDDAREKYILAAENGALAVDLDIALKDLIEDFTGRVPVILSFHGDGKWVLKNVIGMMEDSNADSYKLANFYENLTGFTEDLAIISRFRQKVENPLSFIPMGKGNEILRVASACLVSDFAYSKLDAESAPGQLTYREMSSLINTCMSLRQKR
ncbi:type I 3-dehydroquinate dehydratase [Oxyplasma meridianum]|uniref:3-dehydroquinate dehydratase n=1 Tax=Oxyplasma meridianum TaxID=3073602 RepID=A0AAX4NGY5_9ARCH